MFWNIGWPERLESTRAFNTKKLKYITHIFEDTSDYIFRLWVIKKYKEVTQFINKLCVCDLDVIQTEEIINYEYHGQEAMCEYQEFVNSTWRETASGKGKSQDQPSPPK